MAMQDIVDLDNLLESWAKQRLGTDYVVEKVDTSKLCVHQRAVTYNDSRDWWRRHTVYEEYYDNDSDQDETWHFSHCVKQFRSFASWSVIKAFRSTKFLPLMLHLEFPVSPVGLSPLAVTFDTKLLDQEVRKSTELLSQWSTNEDIPVEPYSSACACAQVRTCCLENVPFMTEVHLSGTVKVQGHKRNRKFSKHEVTVSIADALVNNDHLGFLVVDNVSDPSGPARFVIFRVEGICTGTVGTEAVVSHKQINSLV